MNKIIELHGKGMAKRSFIHIADTVEAINQLIRCGNIGEAYHISPKTKEISIYSIVNLICNIMGYDFKSSIKLISENYCQDSAYLLNSNKIRNICGWSEKISLDEGIKETIQWININWKAISNMPMEYIHKI